MSEIVETFRKSAPKVFKADINKIVESVGDSKAHKTVKNLPSSKKAKKKRQNCMQNIRITRKSKFLNLSTKEAFNKFRLAFAKALIFQYFDPKYDIRIEFNKSDYDIGKILN